MVHLGELGARFPHVVLEPGHVLVHLADGGMQDLPDVGARELVRHVAREEPVGHGAALDDLSLEHLVHNDRHVLRLVLPHVQHLAQKADLRLLTRTQILPKRNQKSNSNSLAARPATIDGAVYLEY